MSRVTLDRNNSLQIHLDRKDKALLKKRLGFQEEEAGVYKPFGLGYPNVSIGDTCGSAEHGYYEVVRKLGYGVDSSVWLVKQG